MPLVAIDTLHASTFTVTLLTAMAWIPWVIIGVPAGAWIDRLPPRPVMLACDAISLLVYASVPVAAWCGALTVAQLIAVALIAVALIAGAATVFTCENSSSKGSGPSRFRAWVIPPEVGARSQDSSQPYPVRERPRQPRGDLLVVLVREQRQRHDQVRDHPGRQLPAPAPLALPGRLDRVIDRVRRNPGRQHAQRDPVRQAPATHALSLTHNPRSCRHQARTRWQTPRSTQAKWH